MVEYTITPPMIGARISLVVTAEGLVLGYNENGRRVTMTPDYTPEQLEKWRERRAAQADDEERETGP